jgi:hypothetical protein
MTEREIYLIGVAFLAGSLSCELGNIVGTLVVALLESRRSRKR